MTSYSIAVSTLTVTFNGGSSVSNIVDFCGQIGAATIGTLTAVNGTVLACACPPCPPCPPPAPPCPPCGPTAAPPVPASQDQIEVDLSTATMQNLTLLLQMYNPLLPFNQYYANVFLTQWFGVAVPENGITVIGLTTDQIMQLIATGAIGTRQIEALIQANQLTAEELALLILTGQITHDEVQDALNRVKKGLAARFTSFIPENRVK